MLTDLQIQRAKPRNREYTLWDGAVPNFGLRVTPSGAKSFVWVGYVAGKKTRRTIGKYPHIELKRARVEALDIVIERPKTITFPSLLDDFKRIYLPTISINTSREWERLLTKHFSHFTTIPDTRAIYAVLERLKPSEANHATVPLKRMFNWAHQTGRIDIFPKISKPNKEKSRERVLSLDELARVLKALDETTFSRIVRLLLLTAARRGEVSTTYKLDKDTVTFPDTKNGKDHVLPITPYMHSLLQHNNTNNTWSKPTHALYKRAGVQGATLHDIRRSVATHMAEQLHIAPHIIERILNHTQKGVAGIYNRATYMCEMREALEKWEAFVLSLQNRG